MSISDAQKVRLAQIQIDGAWIKQIKAGDVLKSRSGALRVVRRVSHRGQSLPKTSVYFTIKRCSWTHRCYTVYNGNDLRIMGFQPVKARATLRKKIDRAIAIEFDRRDAKGAIMRCCDVVGIS